MAKTKTTYTGENVIDFINSYVDNEQKKADSFSLIKLLQEWSGEEAKMFGPTIIGFGNDSFNILKKNLGSKYNIIKAMHYSHYVSKEKYREHINQFIRDWKN